MRLAEVPGELKGWVVVMLYLRWKQFYEARVFNLYIFVTQHFTDQERGIPSHATYGYKPLACELPNEESGYVLIASTGHFYLEVSLLTEAGYPTEPGIPRRP